MPSNRQSKPKSQIRLDVFLPILLQCLVVSRSGPVKEHPGSLHDRFDAVLAIEELTTMPAKKKSSAKKAKPSPKKKASKRSHKKSGRK